MSSEFMYLGPFQGAIAVPSVTRCRCRRRCRRCGHRRAGGVRQYSGDTWWIGVRRLVVANGPNIFQMLLVYSISDLFLRLIYVCFSISCGRVSVYTVYSKRNHRRKYVLSDSRSGSWNSVNVGLRSFWFVHLRWKWKMGVFFICHSEETRK